MYLVESVLNLSNIPSKYYEFTDIFSKLKAEALIPYCLYDLKINLKENVQSSVGTIYSLSASKQEALKEFIEKNGLLCLYINFHSLNYITKKDCYSLLLISDLLDSFCKA